jgi:K+-transporting ATPase KdpF subunit
MKTRNLTRFLILIVVPVTANRPESVENGGNLYIAGAIIALLILVYLVYSLLKPDKF